MCLHMKCLCQAERDNLVIALCQMAVGWRRMCACVHTTHRWSKWENEEKKPQIQSNLLSHFLSANEKGNFHSSFWNHTIASIIIYDTSGLWIGRRHKIHLSWKCSSKLAVTNYHLPFTLWVMALYSMRCFNGHSSKPLKLLALFYSDHSL